MAGHFPSIDDEDIDEEMESNKLNVWVRKNAHIAGTNQDIPANRESLSADIDRKASLRYKEEESDVMKLKVCDPYNDILATENDTNNLSGSVSTNDDP